MNLIRGQKLKLADLLSGLSFELRIQINATPDLVFDTSCFGLDAEGQCSDDRYLVFYNQQRSPCGGVVQRDGGGNGQETFALDLSRLPEAIQRLMFTVTIDGEGTMAQLRDGAVSLHAGDRTLARYVFGGADFQQEKAIMATEIYRRGGEWRLGAVGQGFNGGLSALLEHFGVEEEEDQAPPAPMAADEAVPEQATAGFGFQQTGGGEDRRLDGFRRLLRQCLADGVLTPEEMQRLESYCQQHGLALREALADSQPAIEDFLRGMLADVVSRGAVNEIEEQQFRAVVRFLNPAVAVKREMANVLNRVKFIHRVRSGEVRPMEIAEVNLVTRPEELVWFCKSGIVLVRKLKRRTDRHEGDLWVTSERLVFRSLDYPAEIPIRNILDFEGDAAEFSVIGKTKKTTCNFYLGEGAVESGERYLWSGGDLLEAYVDQTVRKFHRRLNSKVSMRKSRTIPQNVKQAVWARDGGRCVECQASEYLEFDHVIPFSRGGANSVANVQLLCRRCNLKKSDRI